MQIWWVRKALASPAILQACACTAAEHKALLEYNQGVSSDIIQKSIKDSIYLRIEAIKSLNDLLQDPVRSATQSTVLHVNVLMANEALGAHFEVLQAHKEGLKTLVSMMGGLIELEHPMLSTIYQGSLLLAALQNTKPIFPIIAKYRDAIVHEPQMFHNEDIKYDCVVPATLECLGARFTTASWNVEIHPTMKSLIETFRRLVRHFEIGTLFPSIVAPTDNDLFVIFQHELLTTHYASESPCNPNLDECLRHSLLIYLYIRVSHLQELPIMQNMVENFRHSLSGLSYLYTTAPDLLFWILFIGGMASQGYSSHPWFMSHIAIVAHDLELEDWEQVRTLLGGFFYTDQAGQTAAEDLWTEVLLLAGPYRYIAPKSRILAMEID
ncbi:hypothetical protein BJX63DRAFT_432290 [Aspergillus granulosus]|uniref:Uncharacterized protein n=1 Tax=Aspergillus granulosus TaxID=176169 RepID=A0ABR4HC65_9EURO